MTTITKVNWDNVQKLFWNRSDPLSLSSSSPPTPPFFIPTNLPFWDKNHFGNKNVKLMTNSLTEEIFVKNSVRTDGRTNIQFAHFLREILKISRLFESFFFVIFP